MRYLSRRSLSIIGLVAVLPCWSACSSSRGSEETERQGGVATRAADADTSHRTLRMQPTPATCRIIGTIIAIDPELQSDSPKQPCSKAPCKATVRIESVLRKGDAFKGELSAGSTVAMSFVLTLRPSSEVMPHLKESYPGLDVGSRFEAEVRPVPPQPAKGGRSSVAMTAPFVVYDYIRL